MSSQPKNRALLSVTDKTGLVEFALGLSKLDFELVSTGGTAKALREAGLTVMDVSEVTDFPEMLDGRVKTLHPKIHGGLLGDVRLPAHVAQMADHGINPFQVVAVNLYAFEKTVTSAHEFEEAVESIDIGGPGMIRAAAKNSANVTTVVDPSDYQAVLNALHEGRVESLRRPLMAKAFRHTAFYDSMISRYLSDEEFPEFLTMGYRRSQTLRYGENPHQSGAVYVDPLQAGGVANGRLRWGKELSYNNLLDADAAWELVSDLEGLACAIIKHGNPCGTAISSSFGESYRLARASDPISAFGGIAAFNGHVGVEAATAMTEKGNFLEVVLATDFSEEALEIFQSKAGWGQSVRLVECGLAGNEPYVTLRTIRGGVLVQPSDEEPTEEWTVVTKREPTDEEWDSLRLAWKIVKHVKSNAIVICKDNQLRGTGAGQMNRVQSVRLALEQSGEFAAGDALASDAFFPFPDSIQTAAASGVTAFIQPGGSKKDDDSIQAANELGLAMVMTGVRHFRH